jgi:hypothetical protein
MDVDDGVGPEAAQPSASGRGGAVASLSGDASFRSCEDDGGSSCMSPGWAAGSDAGGGWGSEASPGGPKASEAEGEEEGHGDGPGPAEALGLGQLRAPGASSSAPGRGWWRPLPKRAAKSTDKAPRARKCVIGSIRGVAVPPAEGSSTVSCGARTHAREEETPSYLRRQASAPAQLDFSRAASGSVMDVAGPHLAPSRKAVMLKTQRPNNSAKTLLPQDPPLPLGG